MELGGDAQSNQNIAIGITHMDGALLVRVIMLHIGYENALSFNNNRGFRFNQRIVKLYHWGSRILLIR